MKNNFSSLMKSELVERFESVVKEEIRSHNLAVEKSNSTIAALKDDFSKFQREYEILKAENKESYNDVLRRFFIERDSLIESISEQRIRVKDLCDKTTKERDGFRKDIEGLVSVHEFGEYKENVEDRFSSTFRFFERKNFETTSNVENANVILTDKFIGYLQLLEKRMSKFENGLDSSQTAYEGFKTDKAGVLEELEAYKKRCFILEKKIENLYLLIDRLKKGKA